MSKVIYDGLTFDDVLVKPRRAEKLPHEVDIRTYITSNIRLNLPMLSSPMPDVTEHDLAIALALQGGLGVIHRHCTIEYQCGEVKKVKRSQGGRVVDPHTLHPWNTVAEAELLMATQNISGIPIVGENGTLVGILTRRDLGLDNGNGSARDESVEDVMTRDHLVTAPYGVSDQEARAIFRASHVEKILLVDEQSHLRGLITRRDLEKRREYPHATLDDQGRLRVGAAIGVTEDFQERASELMRCGADVLVIDVSHAHSTNVLRALSTLTALPGIIEIIVGNIATAEAARELCDAGASAVKVGIGPGSICTTRIVTGCGVPQISAILEVAEAVRGKIPIIADGGVACSGDIVKAIAAGVDAVMIGSLFAAASESPGEIIILPDGGRYKVYRGMGSQDMLKSGRYGAKAVPEGVEAYKEHGGSVAMIAGHLEGGLRQGMGYAGCLTLRELYDTAFIKITGAGLRESHPHGVLISRMPSNYSGFIGSEQRQLAVVG